MGSPDRGSMIFGITIALFGFTWRIFTAMTPKDDERLTRSGPYRYVRHPYLLGQFLMGLGLMMASKLAVAVFLYLIVSSMAIRVRVRKAEANLSERFGRNYALYCRQVSSFFPQIIPCPVSVERRAAVSLAPVMQEVVEAAIFAFVFLLMAFSMIQHPQVWIVFGMCASLAGLMYGLRTNFRGRSMFYLFPKLGVGV